MSRRFPAFEQLEGNADDVRVLRRKFVINDAALIGRWIARFVVPLEKIEFSSQRSPGDLFAKQLRAERSQAGDVRHVVRIQPSVSIDTDTTQRMCAPSEFGLPTVFT